MADHTVYLPDELSAWAKSEKVNLSATLREGIIATRKRRETVDKTLADSSVHDLSLKNSNGDHYIGRLHGAQIAEGDRDSVYYLTDDEEVVCYDGRDESLTRDMQADDLHDIDPDAYVQIMSALGETAIIDV